MDEVDAFIVAAEAKAGRHVHVVMGPRDGYRFCVTCGESIGRKNRRMIDDMCDRLWKYRPHGTRPA